MDRKSKNALFLVLMGGVTTSISILARRYTKQTQRPVPTRVEIAKETTVIHYYLSTYNRPQRVR